MTKLKVLMARLPVFITTAFLGWGVFVNVANAQATVVKDQQGLGLILCNIITSMIWIVITISIVMVVLAAFHYVTAGDDTEKTEKARKTLTYAAIGIVIALIALGFPSLVADILGNGANATNSYFGDCNV